MSGYNGSNGWNGPSPDAPPGQGAPDDAHPTVGGPQFGGNTGGTYAGGPAFRYGSAEEQGTQLSQTGASFQGRGAPDLSQLGGYEGAHKDAYLARQRELAGLGRLEGYAAGHGPSAANMQMGMALNGSLGANFAAGRDAGNMNAAIQNQAGHSANAIGQGGAARLGEMEQARGGYLGATTALRGGDLGAQHLANQFGISQAQLSQQQMSENDKMQLQYQGLANDALAHQLDAESREYAVSKGNAAQLGAVNYSNSQGLARDLVGGGVGLGTGLASGAMGMGGGGGGGMDPYQSSTGDFNSDVYYSDALVKDVSRPPLEDVIHRGWGM